MDRSETDLAMLVAVGAASAGRRVAVICSTAAHADRLMLRYGSAGGMIQYIVCPNDFGYVHETAVVIDVRGMEQQEVDRG